MAIGDLTREAVQLAIAEFDRLDRDTFLAKYQFGRARSYFLVANGRHYDSKAIVGAAHGYLGGRHRPLGPDDFVGGEATVAKVLRNLGYEVTSSGTADGSDSGHRNPTWVRDELILALDLYMAHRGRPPGQKSAAVIELSDLLNRLGVQLGRDPEGTYRNPNGVYMKLMNFMRFDPDVLAAGKVGLQRGGRDEEAVWNEFADQPDRLRHVANAIRQTVDLPVGERLQPNDDADDDVEAEEGRLMTRLHRSRERSRKLVEQRKRQAMARAGRLRCEVCNFDFEARYGERGHGFIEAHHTKPVHTLEPLSKTKLADLALLCANCHRMIHSTRPWLTVEKLRQLVTKA